MLTVEKAVNVLKKGELIAYPTEAVYGLGCDPQKESAVYSLLALKSRPVFKGLILVADHWEQISDWCLTPNSSDYERALKSWPGPYTWLFPASPKVPSWIKGDHATVALRISAHPVVRALTKAWGGPLVSTSANRAGEAPIRQLNRLKKQFGEQVAGIVSGNLGHLAQPTSIRNVMTGQYVERSRPNRGNNGPIQ